jgi:hypothetical protein
MGTLRSRLRSLTYHNQSTFFRAHRDGRGRRVGFLRTQPHGVRRQLGRTSVLGSSPRWAFFLSIRTKRGNLRSTNLFCKEQRVC